MADKPDQPEKPKKKITSQEAFDLLKNYEKFSATVYPDKANVATIGYGMTKYEFPGLTLQSTNVLTEPQAAEMLRSKLEEKFIPKVREYIQVPLNNNQLGALASFMYNVGEPNFAASTMRKKLNQGDYVGALQEFPRWNKVTVDGKKEKSAGLTDRRQAEMALFSGDIQTLGRKLEQKKFGPPGYAKKYVPKEPKQTQTAGGIDEQRSD